jgi:photosystem II stability/assembly factor-like uncharacterized protein
MTLRHYLVCLILCSLLLAACQSTSPSQWQWERAEAGLPRQSITLAVAADPTDPNRLWVGYYAPAGLATSDDGGQTWTTGIGATGLADNPVFDLLFVPPQGGETSGTLWAAVRDGLLRSVDGGANWQLLVDGLPPAPVFALAADATGRVYAGLDDAGVYAQGEEAHEWETLTPPQSPFAGGDVRGGLASTAVLSLAVSPDGRQLYAGTADRGIFASQDGGRTWVNTYPDHYVPNLALNPTNPAQAVASLRDRLVRTRDGGQSWHTLPVAWAQDEVASLLWLENGALGAGTGQGRLYRSLDGGDSWVEGGTGLPRGSVLDLAVIGTRLLVATWTGLYDSEDGGETWRYLTSTLGNPNAQALLTTEAGLLLGTRAGLFRWQPDTRQWEVAPGDFPPGGIASLAADPANPQLLYAGTSGDGLYRSVDGGANWQRMPTLGVGIPAVAVDPKDGDRVYILAAWERVYESRDGGQSWQARWEGLGDAIEAASIAVDPLKSNVYVGTETGLYRSHNNGFWRPVAPTLADQTVLALLAQPAPPSAGGGTVLYLGTTRGVYRSLDGGATVQGRMEDWNAKRGRLEDGWWEDEGWGQGLENVSVTALLADPDNPSLLYAGTAYAGVYQSLDWGHTWQPIGPVELTEDVVEGLAWGPENELFVASASGVWVGMRR